MPSPRHEFHVPGAYHFDNPPATTSFPPTRPLGADVFLPPTDSVYGADLSRSVGSLYSDIPSGGHSYENGGAKRKRATQDSRESTPVATAEWGAYTLGGQIGVTGAQGMDESVYSDVEYRRALGPTSLTDETSADAERERWTVLHALGNVVGKVWEFCTTGAFRGFHAGGGAAYDWETGKEAPNAVAEETPNEDTRDETPAPILEDIPRSATPTQRTGKRRQVSLGAGDELGRNWVMVDARQKRATVHQTPTQRRGGAPLLGGRASTAGTPVRHTKTPDRRATTTYTRGTTTATPGTAASRRINTPISRLGAVTPTTQSRRGAGASVASTARVSHAGSPALSSREPASFASPRSSTPVAAASPRRNYTSSGINSRIPMPLSGGEVNPFARTGTASPRPSSRAGRASSMAVGRPASPAAFQGHGHRRSYSGRVGMSPLPKKALYVDTEDITLDITENPRLNEEAKRLAAQNLAADQESDAQIEAFNLRLKEMIRQGQEALGTTFEVDGDDDGGGGDDYWADD
ncbi:hypothetical protein SEUCBS139899_005854 [Sporothrix eucalyptigena]